MSNPRLFTGDYGQEIKSFAQNCISLADLYVHMFLVITKITQYPTCAHLRGA
jgi:hypothetical protein